MIKKAIACDLCQISAIIQISTDNVNYNDISFCPCCSAPLLESDEYTEEDDY